MLPIAVIGANFGDEGKGLVTDYLADKYSLVVLHNGGPQRAHTVTTPDGKEHIFRHIGAGTFRGADTFIARQFICNPIIFREEYNKISKKVDKMPNIYIDSRCKFTTIYDMLVNQAREIQRGTLKHGSCGLGIFETICRYNDGCIKVKEQTIRPYGITIGEFKRLSYLERYDYLVSLRKYYTEKRIDQTSIKSMPKELEIALYSDIAINNFINDFDFMIEKSILVNECGLFWGYEKVIFENGQGLLLDQDNMEYFPHLTPSHTGLYNVNELLTEIGYVGEIKTYFVTRSYMTRHGVGRFDTECEKSDINVLMWDRTNVTNLFQDNLRYGFLDTNDLARRIRNEISQSIRYVVPIIFVTHQNEYSVSPAIFAMDIGRDTYEVWLSSNCTREEVRKDFFRI